MAFCFVFAGHNLPAGSTGELCPKVRQPQCPLYCLQTLAHIINTILFSCSGWDEGCMTMSKGEIAKLTIPSAKGYGSGGFPAWGYPFSYK